MLCILEAYCNLYARGDEDYMIVQLAVVDFYG